jgi:diketogulonate reductase-like aldo/keto reductase
MQLHRTLHGIAVPQFMYGTAWKEDRTEALTRLALAAGFRAIDTANQCKHYFEAGVGKALADAFAEGTLGRGDVFLQTKFTYQRGQDHRLPYDPHAPFAVQVEESFRSSLEHLGTTYVDSFVLHGPQEPRNLVDADREVWRAMEERHRQGEAKLLGVSNVSVQQLEQLIHFAQVPIAFVQNRCFARTGWDRAVRELCRKHGVIYQGFSLLTANDRELHSQSVRVIAERHGVTVPQVVFRFALAVGMLPLTGTANAEHMRQDLASASIELAPDELNQIERIGVTSS